MELFFDTAFGRLGKKALDFQKLRAEVQAQYIAHLASYTEYASLYGGSTNPAHQIKVGYFDSSKPNGCAAILDGQDIIGISSEVPKLKEGLFREIIEQPFFAEIPDHEQEGAVSWLGDCAQHFLFWHELAHVWNGHTSFQAKAGVLFIDELSAVSDKLGNLDYQTMEMDADGFAAATSFNHLSRFAFPHRLTAIEGKLGPGTTSLTLGMVAIYLLFRLFDAAADFDDEERKSHPSPPLRQRLIAGSLAAQAKRSGAMEERAALSIVLAAAHLGENLYADSRRIPRDSNAFDEALGERGDLYQRKLLRHWRVLRPQLDVLKRRGTLVPVQDIPDET